MTVWALQLECDEPSYAEDEEDPKPAKQKSPAEDKDRGSTLTWWFRACCFCYSLVGLDMAWRLPAVTCYCPAYPWHVEAFLLMLQGCLSFMHDAYFAGRSPVAKAADRCCATFLTLCQPIKLAFCQMDGVQLALLMCFWTLGLLCFTAGGRAFAAGDGRRYQVFHTLWHIALPLGGFLWIEYSRTLVTLRASPLSMGTSPGSASAAGTDPGGAGGLGFLASLWGTAALAPECGARAGLMGWR